MDANNNRRKNAHNRILQLYWIIGFNDIKNKAKDQAKNRASNKADNKERWAVFVQSESGTGKS